MTTTWTIKTSDALDELVREATRKLGYNSKGELIREAVRSFLLEKEVFFSPGNLDNLPVPEESPVQSLKALRQLKISRKKSREVLDAGRDQIESLLREAAGLE